MFRFIKKHFFIAVIFVSCNVLISNILKYVSINNRECKIRYISNRYQQ